jgi:hypothetical protein
MAGSSYELNQMSLVILEYIDKFDSVHEKQIHLALPRIESLSLRLSELSEPEYKSTPFMKIPEVDTSFLVAEYNGDTSSNSRSFSISRLGKLVLQDHRVKQRKLRNTEIFEHLRYGFTTLIAVAALINSILAQLGL